jgi:hypothetical protein
MSYNIKFMFADASVMEDEFPMGASIQEAKLKLISNWPAGPIFSPHICHLFLSFYHSLVKTSHVFDTGMPRFQVSTGHKSFYMFETLLKGIITWF